MTNEELEARCRESGAVEDYAVYGDWLEERGDPQGKLIAMQIAGLEDEWTEYIDEHDELFGVRSGVEVTWKYGFWQTLRTRGQAIDLAAALARPVARLLESITLDYEGTSPREFYATLTRSSRIAAARVIDALGRMLRWDHDGGGWQSILPEVRRLGLGCTELVFRDGQLSEAYGKEISKLDGLRRLSIYAHPPISTPRETFLALAPLADSLISLVADDCYYFDDESLAMLSAFEHLEELRIRAAEVTTVGIRMLAARPRLRHLDLQACRLVDDETAHVLGTFPALESVGIDDTPISGTGVIGLARVTKTIKEIIVDTGQYPFEVEEVIERGIRLANRRADADRARRGVRLD